jgi:pimeloyl-ACP methyl ester carboxylesterase
VATIGSSRITLFVVPRLTHNRGGAVVWRVCLWHPEFVTHLFSICTPYFPPGKGKFLSLETRVKTIMPNFAYQLQLASGEPETIVVGKDKIRQFLKGMYGGTTPEKEPSFSVKEGILYDRLDRIQMTPLLSEAELEYYTEEYVRNGIGGSLAWYKTSEVNFNEDQELNQSEIPIPTLFVAGLKDAALIPAMSRGMEQHIPKLTRKEVNTGHWALWEDPATVNSYLKEWLEGTYFADKNKL